MIRMLRALLGWFSPPVKPVEKRPGEFYTPGGALRTGHCPCGAGMDRVLSDSKAKCVAGHVFEIYGPDWGLQNKG